MVDPNRKINKNLNDDDEAYLRECETEFRNRFTDTDEEYAAHCAKPTRPPPIMTPWHGGRSFGNNQPNKWRNNRGGGGGGGGGGYQNNNDRRKFHPYNNGGNRSHNRLHNRPYHNRGAYDRDYRRNDGGQNR